MKHTIWSFEVPALPKLTSLDLQGPGVRLKADFEGGSGRIGRNLEKVSGDCAREAGQVAAGRRKGQRGGLDS
jgi:hypothetical protein